MNWESIDQTSSRLWVPCGWIVRTVVVEPGMRHAGYVAIAQTLVPDAEHAWVLGQRPPAPKLPDRIQQGEIEGGDGDDPIRSGRTDRT